MSINQLNQDSDTNVAARVASLESKRPRISIYQPA